MDSLRKKIYTSRDLQRKLEKELKEQKSYMNRCIKQYEEISGMKFEI